MRVLFSRMSEVWETRHTLARKVGGRAFRPVQRRNSGRENLPSRHSHANTRDTMEANDEDEDVKLARASGGLLADLESCLQKVLWKPSRNHGASHGRVHSRVRQKDLEYLINLVCSTP
jgi:hypothetical protein